MKQMLTVLFIVTIATSLFIAAGISAKAEEAKTFVGRIESIERIVKSSPPKWEYARFTIAADNGEKMVIRAIKATAVTDASGKDLNEGGKKFGGFSLKKGERVEVKYSTEANGRNEALSIRCVAPDYVGQTISPTTPERSSAVITAQPSNGLIGHITQITPPGGLKRVPFWRIKFVPDNGGDHHILFITGKTVIIDTDGKRLTAIPESLKENKKIEVKYSEDTAIFADGKDADLIRYLPLDNVPQPPVQTAAVQVAQGTTVQPGNTFTGRVEKVTPTMYRSQSQPYCKILVAADNGEKTIFFVPGTASVTDAAGKDMSEGGKKLGGLSLKKGQRIEVTYSIITNGSSITNGQKGADAIRCLD